MTALTQHGSTRLIDRLLDRVGLLRRDSFLRTRSITIVMTAMHLRSEDGENPEYDRALVELTSDLTGLTREQAIAAIGIIEAEPQDIHQHAQAIRDLGGVVAVFTPEEVEGVSEDNHSRIQDAMIEAGNEAIEHLSLDLGD